MDHSTVHGESVGEDFEYLAEMKDLVGVVVEPQKAGNDSFADMEAADTP